MKKTIKLIDGNFDGVSGISLNLPSPVEWSRTTTEYDIAIYTDSMAFSQEINPEKINCVWLLEPPIINGDHQGKAVRDYKNFKYQYPPLDKDGKVIGAAEKKKKPKTSFQEDDEDAPDTTVSVKIVKLTKTYEGKQHKITRKIYALEDGTQHVVEIEDY